MSSTRAFPLCLVFFDLGFVIFPLATITAPVVEARVWRCRQHRRTGFIKRLWLGLAWVTRPFKTRSLPALTHVLPPISTSRGGKGGQSGLALSSLFEQERQRRFRIPGGLQD